MKVYKRNGAEQDFCLDKIISAIKKANNAVSDEGRLTDEQFDKVVATVEKFLEPFDTVKVEDIQDLVEKALMKHNRYEIAKAYILFRDKKQNQKLYDDVDEQVLAITKGESAELRGDNANKHIDVNSSIRDYIAGTECKSLAQKMLDKIIIAAHKRGWLHYHDMDYSPVMPLHNCDVFNIEDMLDNGFMMNDTKITRPRRFSTAANLAAQINLIISGSQYGGQTFSWAPLAKYVESTRVDCKIELLTILSVLPKWLAFILKPWYSKMVEVMVKRDIHVGIKTYQYQVLCHQSSNGQTPFVSNVINLREAMGKQEQKDLAFIIEEILKRRTKGVLDKLGKPMPPLFPKLLYYTCDGLNVKKGDPYFYLTELAAKCITVRMQPDIISEKKNREVKKGQMIPCMGCRSFLAPIWEERRYPRNTKFYWQYTTSSNVQYEGAPGRNLDFNRKIEYGVLPHYDVNCGIAINFRGNTGWLKETTDEEVVILQPIVYGRFNMGVVTINLPHCALSAVKSVKDNNMDPKYLKDEFYRILDERLDICHKALLTRWESVKNIKAKNSPILWQHGALARLNEDDTIGDWVMKHEPAFTSISLGYVGLYETCMALTGESNTTVKGQKASSKILQYLNKKMLKNDNPVTTPVIEEINQDAYERLIAPAIERDIRNELTEKAEDGAISVFGKNLTQLLMAPPIAGKTVLGWDPAFRTGCKLAVVDKNGKVLDTVVIYPTAPQKKISQSKEVLKKLISKYRITLISLGNGTASRESEQVIVELLKEIPQKVSYAIVSEAGASVYSASKLATEEFPEFDVGQRSAASIARRLQDPLAELVKIDPKAIGVGQYQHDMNQKKLSQVLEGTVEDCVNSVGIDLNTASASLLEYVSGISKTIAKNIVAYREENGSFDSRKQLLKVPKLGPKAYEQCAGFLRIRNGSQPLDNTGIHPESYEAAGALIKLLGGSEKEPASAEVLSRVEGKDLAAAAAYIGVGEITLQDIVNELKKPGRDPRSDMPKPVLRTDVLDMADLKEGMVLKGTVRNVIDFGAFVDIGVHQDGLIHISKLTDKKFIKHPLEVVSVGDVVEVKVLSVDLVKKRIQLSMIL